MEPPYLMLIEDNKDDQEAITRGFRSNDCPLPIKWFSSASSALEFLLDTTPSEHPRLLFLDLNIPGMDGRTFLKHLKSHSTLCRIPVIVLTTSADQKDISSCYKHGASSYIQKPIRFSQMKDICRNIIEYWFKSCLLTNPVDLRSENI